MRRRTVIAGAGAILATRTVRAAADGPPSSMPEGKKGFIELSLRPPNYEAPLSAFIHPITANENFYVRYHGSRIPVRDALNQWVLSVGGPAARKAVTLTMADLQRLPQHEIAAVCQGAGNMRRTLIPPAPGLQWGPGAMGCALWRGPRLRDVIAGAGMAPTAIELASYAADGSDEAFCRSIPINRALDDDTILAINMNGEALPIWNGYPARLVVPGWAGIAWTKHLVRLEMRNEPLKNRWMTKSYRLPAGLFLGSPFPSQESTATWPITDIPVNSLVTSHADGDIVRGNGFTLSGLAWDNGSGIARVEISITDGVTWGLAMLGPEESRYAFRPWSIQIAASAGPVHIKLRATANSGRTQPLHPLSNPKGYLANAIQVLTLQAG